MHGEQRKNGALRNGFLNGLQIFRAGMEKEMDVRVNQAGHERDVAEVNYFRAARMRDGCANFGDARSLDKNFAGRDNFAGLDIEVDGRREGWCRVRRCEWIEPARSCGL